MTVSDTTTDKQVRPAMDPVTFEVIRNAITNMTEEMAVTVRRAAFSTNIKTRADFSCAFLTQNLDVLRSPLRSPRTWLPCRQLLQCPSMNMGQRNFRQVMPLLSMIPIGEQAT